MKLPDSESVLRFAIRCLFFELQADKQCLLTARNDRIIYIHIFKLTDTRCYLRNETFDRKKPDTVIYGKDTIIYRFRGVGGGAVRVDVKSGIHQSTKKIFPR